MIGLSWLAVLSIASLPDDDTSHAQPLPNRVVAALANCSLKLSKPPNWLAITSAILPVGAPPAFGAISVQNSEWLAWPPPLLRTAVRIASGSAFRSLIRSSTLFACRSGCASSAAFRLLM